MMTYTTSNVSLKTYSELIKIKSFDDRLSYLQIKGMVGEQTFGYDRYLNQKLYHSREWKQFRNNIIVRDNGCDLGCKHYDITGRILIHHITPLTPDQILNGDDLIFDPDNVICVSHDTHNIIHYGYDSIRNDLVERKPNDQSPWRHNRKEL